MKDFSVSSTGYVYKKCANEGKISWENIGQNLIKLLRLFSYILENKKEILYMERQSKPRQDLTNQTFGYLTPFEYIKGGKWKCKCKCGNETIVYTKYLKSGHTQS